MKYIDDIIKSVRMPNPIFTLSLDDDAETIRMSDTESATIDKNCINDENILDILWPLLSISPIFSKATFTYTIDEDSIRRKFITSIRDSLIECICSTLNIKRRKLNSLERWMNNGHDDRINNIFIELFIYLKTPCIVQSSFKDHVTNVHLILEAMKEKYDK